MISLNASFIISSYLEVLQAVFNSLLKISERLIFALWVH